MSTPPAQITGYDFDNDSALGSVTDLWDASPTPDDFDTPLADYEAIVDPTQAGTVTSIDMNQFAWNILWWILSHLDQAVPQGPSYRKIRIKHIQIRKIRMQNVTVKPL